MKTLVIICWLSCRIKGVFLLCMFIVTAVAGKKAFLKGIQSIILESKLLSYKCHICVPIDYTIGPV